MNNITNKSEIGKENQLYKEYDWYYKNYESAIQKAADEFFSEMFSVKLVSLSKNINILFQGEDYFVTKIRIDKQHDAFLRYSSGAVQIILDSILGKNKKFDLVKITELEAKIMSTFNDYIYESTSNFLLAPPSATQKRRKFDTIHLTLFIKEKNSDTSAKIIFSLPESLLSPELSIQEKPEFDILSFRNTTLTVDIKVGTTSFLLKEIKNIEKDDIVIFENSNIEAMELIYKDYRKKFRLNPNLGLVTSISNDNGGNNMEENSLSQDLWDNIQVEMGAEFEKVKITLGELKNIEEGLVVDISSVYNSKVSLTVDNRTIAKGELVIIDDHYGVRVEEVLTSDKESDVLDSEQDDEFESIHQESDDEKVDEDSEINDEEEDSDEEFDYSDFELENEDI